MELKFRIWCCHSQPKRPFNRTAYGIEITYNNKIMIKHSITFNRTAYGIEIQIQANKELADYGLLIAPLMELKCKRCSASFDYHWLLIAPLMELKFKRVVY